MLKKMLKKLRRKFKRKEGFDSLYLSLIFLVAAVSFIFSWKISLYFGIITVLSNFPKKSYYWGNLVHILMIPISLFVTSYKHSLFLIAVLLVILVIRAWYENVFEGPDTEFVIN